jgi:hypothetical protein
MATYEIIAPKSRRIPARLFRVCIGKEVAFQALVVTAWQAMLVAPDHSKHTLVFTTRDELFRYGHEEHLGLKPFLSSPRSSGKTLTLYDDYARKGNAIPPITNAYVPDLGGFTALSCESSSGQSTLYSEPNVETANLDNPDLKSYTMTGNDIEKDDLSEAGFTPKSAENI